ncbi:MAG: YkvA family protein [Candidatus Cloacimonetes bacterium]|nr:YkvA family protein [Candidatus Cloacimonadota bacterium]
MNEDILNGREIPAEEQESLKDKIIDIDAEKLKFYENLRQKAKGWTLNKGGSIGGKLSEYLFLLPDFFILVCRLALDKRVPTKQKLMAGGIIAYVIMPLDIIPDFIPVIGHVDDLVLVVMGLNMILNEIDPKVLADNWSGEGEVLAQMKKITATAETFLDKNVLQRIKNWLSRK